MIRLQNIIFPKPGICYETEMFYRLAPVPEPTEGCYLFDAQKAALTVSTSGVVFFDTYFNSLSLGKWMKYTNATRFALKLKLKGAFSVSLLHSSLINGAVLQKTLAVQKVSAEEAQEFVLSYPECEPVGMLSFRLDALRDESVFYGGWFAAEEYTERPRPVELAMSICNYNREAYIYRNFRIIDRYILQNPDSELREHLSIFIADNSASIDVGKVTYPTGGGAFVYPQGDFGGAGGFTRGLMEILAVRRKYRLTHVVMMDDDVLIEPESLERLYAFLRVVKEEYRSTFVGGALLRLDFQSVQTINGGDWSLQNRYVMHKTCFNLSRLPDILANETEDGAKISGWWFHCIPVSQISRENLPYPFFFHMDDVEYDLRNCRRVINLNGVCVWHEPFEHKPGSHLSYYNTRNILITQMLHFEEFNLKQAKLYLAREFFHHLWVYRYKEAALALHGIEDALRGPEWLAAQNPEQLLEDVLAQGYKKRPLEELPVQLDYAKYLEALHGGPPESKWGRRARRFSLNGYLRKADHDAVVPMDSPLIRTTYRAKRVLNYDPVSDRGYVTEKSYRELFRLLRQYFKTRRSIRKRFEAARAEYKARFPEMTAAPFWRNYLGIEQDGAGKGSAG